jgi:hypothetical protein
VSLQNIKYFFLSCRCLGGIWFLHYYSSKWSLRFLVLRKEERKGLLFLNIVNTFPLSSWAVAPLQSLSKIKTPSCRYPRTAPNTVNSRSMRAVILVENICKPKLKLKLPHWLPAQCLQVSSPVCRQQECGYLLLSPAANRFVLKQIKPLQIPTTPVSERCSSTSHAAAEYDA